VAGGQAGAEDAGKELGFDLEWVGPATVDFKAMLQLLDNAVDSRADGILFVPPPIEGIEQVYEKAKKAGIPMVSVQGDIPAEMRLSNIGTNPAAYGQRAAELLGQKMNGKAKIAVITDNLTSQFQNAKLESLKKTLAEKYPGMELVVVEADESDIAIAVDKIDQILKNLSPDQCLCDAGGGRRRRPPRKCSRRIIARTWRCWELTTWRKPCRPFARAGFGRHWCKIFTRWVTRGRN